ncbi:MAG: hypothetical protein K9J13_09440 [Saprospiraceae bacterium]|nr:hypothetical protein [Saprospiraceae bacterium]
MKSKFFLCFVILTLILNTNSIAQKTTKTIHVFVALCDNENQGIVPVPPKIGNGKDANNNLYWGCGYGVRTYFKKSADWTLIKQIKNPESKIIERCVFKHKTNSMYLVADAYDGAEIKQCITDFLKASSGSLKKKIIVDSVEISFGGNSSLIAYCGHNGLMEFYIDYIPEKVDSKKRDVIILACISKSYFSPLIKKSGANPLLWTTGFMAPEAYTLEWAIRGWVKNETALQIRERAAEAYSHYHPSCSLSAAKRLLVTGY